MTRDEMLDAVYDEVTANDTCVEDAVVSLLEEIVRLRGERDAMEGMSSHHAEVALEAIAQLNNAQAILAALREPSGKVIRRMTQRTIEGLHHVDLDIVLDAIRVALPAAVEAAEQEVNP